MRISNSTEKGLIEITRDHLFLGRYYASFRVKRESAREHLNAEGIERATCRNTQPNYIQLISALACRAMPVYRGPRRFLRPT